jgi:8-oxo-dGTP pyrophosphatase MutT (NUDIX family)
VTGPAARVDDTLARQLRAHVPGDSLEVRSLHRIERLLAWLSDPFDEHADPTHVTGSAIVRDDDGRVLLHRHKRLGIWLQPGGHLETGEQPWDAAVRETREETGVAATHPAGDPFLVHVDVHEGPRGHVHLDLRYLLHADGGAPLAPAPGESPAVDWFPAPLDPRLDASLRAAIAAARRR